MPSRADELNKVFRRWWVFAAVMLVAIVAAAVSISIALRFSTWGIVGTVFASVGIFGAAASLFSTLTQRRSLGWKTFRAVVLGIWLIAPPTWIMLDYVLRHPNGIPDKVEREHVKETNDLLRNLWAAVSTVLGGSYLKKEEP
jgi:uncharacterized membrane protein YccF (DUF307 family)